MSVEEQRTHRGVWQRLRHHWSGPRLARRTIDAAALTRLEARVRASEAGHSGQIRLCIEGALPPSYLRRDAGARERALAMFSKLRVWDTEHNNGVLIYLLASDRAIEIVVDRGLRARVPPATWQTVIASMREDFRTGQFEAGLDKAIAAADAQLRAHFPPSAAGAATGEDNLPDRPVLL